MPLATASPVGASWERVQSAQREAHRLFVLSLNARSPEDHRQAINRVREGLAAVQRALREERAEMEGCGFAIRRP